MSQVHDAHPAPAEAPLDTVLPGEHGRQRAERETLAAARTSDFNLFSIVLPFYSDCLC